MMKIYNGFILKFLAFLVASWVVLVSCQIFTPSKQRPETTDAALATEQAIYAEQLRTLPIEAGENSAGEDVLTACDLEGQSKAMRPDQVPDWERLDLSACYDLNLQITEAGNSYTGSERLTYKNATGQPLTSLVLRLYPNAKQIYGGQLKVTSAEANGADIPFEVYLSDKTGLRLNLPEPLQSGESIVLALAFSGEVPIDFGGQSGVYGIFNYASDDQVMTLANWYPILAEWRGNDWMAETVTGIGDAVVSEAALFKVQITIPEGWQVVTTGSEVEQTAQNNSQYLVFTSGPARDFIVSASPQFIQNRSDVDGIQINHWGLPGIEAWVHEALQETRDAVQLFDKRFGAYPYAELDVVSVPLNLASGVEYPGVFLVGKDIYNPNSEHPFLLGIVVSHETSHQWWYGVVGNNVLEDPWQDEALATFSSLVFLQIYQQQYYGGTLDYYRTRVAEIEKSKDDTDISQPVTAFKNRPREYSPVVYDKGALFYVALRERLGDDVFFNALQTYYSQNRYKLVAPIVLLQSFEEACGCDLGDFYTQWGVK